LALGEILLESGLPSGAINILPCSGDEATQLIVDERVALVSFTGSPAVGWDLKQRAHRQKVVLELGGNAAVIVDRDIRLKPIAGRIALGAYANAGQSCIAVQRVYVHESVYEQFLDHFLASTRSTAVGNPEEDSTIVGPMIDEDAARKVEVWLAEAVAAGAKVLYGGTRDGAVFQPTVLTNVPSDTRISCQEVFAPVAIVEPFSTFEQAVGMVNNSEYGLQAGVFTDSLVNALYAYQHLEVGGVVLNDYPTFRIDHMPYGGVKGSGFGREGIRYAIEEMTEPKLLVVNQKPW
jgi:acyl-CoA reductase-like NAD-dependent aldehyde dehydrogenase